MCLLCVSLAWIVCHCSRCVLHLALPSANTEGPSFACLLTHMTAPVNRSVCKIPLQDSRTGIGRIAAVSAHLFPVGCQTLCPQSCALHSPPHQQPSLLLRLLKHLKPPAEKARHQHVAWGPKTMLSYSLPMISAARTVMQLSEPFSALIRGCTAQYLDFSPVPIFEQL